MSWRHHDIEVSKIVPSTCLNYVSDKLALGRPGRLRCPRWWLISVSPTRLLSRRHHDNKTHFTLLTLCETIHRWIPFINGQLCEAILVSQPFLFRLQCINSLYNVDYQTYWPNWKLVYIAQSKSTCLTCRIIAWYSSAIILLFDKIKNFPFENNETLFLVM